MAAKGSRRICRECGALASDGVTISARALCPPCSERRQVVSCRQINDRSGEFHARWIEGMQAAAARARRAHRDGDTGEGVTMPADNLAEK